MKLIATQLVVIAGEREKAVRSSRSDVYRERQSKSGSHCFPELDFVKIVSLKSVHNDKLLQSVNVQSFRHNAINNEYSCNGCKFKSFYNSL